MPSEGAVLGFDSAGNWCCAALLRDRQVLARRHEDMGRGQGERLMPLLEEVLAEAGLAWGDLAALGVGVGPGNFTGIRISVAAARGLALGLGIPAIGISRFEALALDGPALPVLVPALRGQAWIARPGGPGEPPELVDPAKISGPVIAETGAFPGLASQPPALPLAVAIARLASERRHQPQPRPAPLYLREADAAPHSERPPALLP